MGYYKTIIISACKNIISKKVAHAIYTVNLCIFKIKIKKKETTITRFIPGFISKSSTFMKILFMKECSIIKNSCSLFYVFLICELCCLTKDFKKIRSLYY